MSQLNVPRLYFVGELIADPSTVNNIPRDFTPGALPPPAAQG